jgi:D-threonate/D-erythronate kinase
MIGVIADDLTGAAELGAVGLRLGFSAEVVTNGDPSGEADLVCVDTDSRAQAPAEAARRVTAAAKLLQKAGAEWIYKKVDSVLRGQVTAEIEAMMKQLGFERALLAPANPSLGRTIRDGKYFIRGKPVHKTEFARDPQFPRTSARVLELLKMPQFVPICVSTLRDAVPEQGIVIAEASSPQDVRHWAQRRVPGMLLAGGAEFFGALLAAVAPGKAALPPPTENISNGGAAREFFVSGSSTAVARKFATAARREKTPVFSLPLELAWGASLRPEVSEAIGQRIVSAFNSHPRVILTVGLPPVRNAQVSQGLAGHVVQIAEAALRRLEVGRVYADGGATAAELVWRMGWSRLKVLRELAPGVATLSVAGDKSILLTIKPGSYAWPEQWTQSGRT